MTRRIRNHPEQDLQISIAQYLDIALPDDAAWFAVENGFKRTRAEAGIGKAMGRKPGVPDLCIVRRGQAYFFELKAGRNRPTDKQEAMQQRLMEAGAVVVNIYSLDEMYHALRGLAFPLRAAPTGAAA